MRTGEPLVAGEVCLLNDVRGKQYLVTLTEGVTFQSDKGSIRHEAIIGEPEGSLIPTNRGTPFVALRPRLADYVLRMKRGAAVMYPKDTGPLITWADIAPGCVVVEAGTGSGGLTLALSRAVGQHGKVVSVERRDDHATHARRLIEAFAGKIADNIDLRVGDVESVIEEISPDRIVLDLPEPWHSVKPAAQFLKGGGTFASYLPTVPQIQTLREAIDDAKTFTEIETFEVFMRNWTIDGRSVRPDHRMVGHTGFITIARKRLKRTISHQPSDVS
jgi:tRNA (adenine57-N1/adenine58-N1)-methyltransferase